MSSAAESFLYIWYDTKNKKYYLGKHKGTPDDSYTHSSTIMESFNKDNTPSYMKRRILAYGTDEEMCLLEHECLKNRKEKKWERYYNVHVGDPRYVDQRGENSPLYKHGMSYDKEWNRERWKLYYQKNRDKRIENQRQYVKENKDKVKEYQREYQKEYQKKYYENNKGRLLEEQRKYREENREKINERQRIRRAKQKAERLASGATLPI